MKWCKKAIYERCYCLVVVFSMHKLHVNCLLCQKRDAATEVKLFKGFTYQRRGSPNCFPLINRQVVCHFLFFSS